MLYSIFVRVLPELVLTTQTYAYSVCSDALIGLSGFKVRPRVMCILWVAGRAVLVNTDTYF